MKSKKIVVFALLSAFLLGCSQKKIVELPLTMQNGYGPFNMVLEILPPIIEDENSPWKNTYPKILNFPEGLTDMKYGYIETNFFQSAYQNYLLGNITKETYEKELQKSNRTPDTLNLSKTPIKTKIAFVYGKDSEGVLKIAVDANNNLDLSDDKLFIPLELNWDNVDSLAQKYAFDVSFETFVHNKILSVSAPLFIAYSSPSKMFAYNFFQHAITQYKGTQIAISSGGFTNLSYNYIDLALTNNLKKGDKVKNEDTYSKNDYIKFENEIFKILGVNANKKVLVLAKIDLPKSQLFSKQVGYKPYPLGGEDFTKKTNISLESLKGKYVLLDFWSEWCVPCLREIPNLKELYLKTDRSKFDIIGIVGKSSPDGIKKLIDKNEITWPQILSDSINKITETYKINGYPTTLLIDTNGIIIAKDLIGKELEEKVLSLIKE